MRCLVTRLEGVIDDSSLKRLGEIRMRVKANSGDNFYIERSADSTEPLYVEAVGGLSKIATSNGGALMSKIEIASFSSVYLSEGDYELRIIHRDALRKLSSANASFMYLDGAEWNDMSNLTSLELSYSMGGFDVSLMGNLPKLDSLNLAGQQTTGDLRGIATIPNLYSIMLNGVSIVDDISVIRSMPIRGSIKILQSNGITGDGMSAAANKSTLVELDYEGSANIGGDLSSIAELTNLRTLKINGTKVTGNLSAIGKMVQLTTFQPSNNLTGSVEDMIANFRANGKETGTFTLLYALSITGATFEGQSIQNWLVANGGRSSLRVTWTATSITGESV